MEEEDHFATIQREEHNLPLLQKPDKNIEEE